MSQQMKYSEFLENVVIPEYIKQNNYDYLCNFLDTNRKVKQHKEYYSKLSNTITHKIVKYAKSNGYIVNDVTLNFIFGTLKKSNIERKNARINWLKTLAAIHKAKGN